MAMQRLHAAAGTGLAVSLPAYTVVGAASMLGGVTRMTFSITVLAMEGAGALQIIVPLMLAIFMAKARRLFGVGCDGPRAGVGRQRGCPRARGARATRHPLPDPDPDLDPPQVVGDAFGPSIYDVHIKIRGAPVLVRAGGRGCRTAGADWRRPPTGAPGAHSPPPPAHHPRPPTLLPSQPESGASPRQRMAADKLSVSELATTEAGGTGGLWRGAGGTPRRE